MHAGERTQMSSPSNAWFPSPPGGEIPGVAIRFAFSSPTIALSRWRCGAGGPGWTPERAQHWHVLTFVHGGAYRLRSPLGTDLVDSTCVHCFNQGEPFSTDHPFGCGDYGSALVVRHDVLLDIARAGSPLVAPEAERPFRQLKAPLSPQAYLLQRLVAERLRRESCLDPLAIEETLLGLAAAALSPPSVPLPDDVRATTTPGARRAVGAAREMIAVHYREPLLLADVARAADLSPFHLCRLFKRLTGVPVHRYLTGYRLRAALEVVLDPRADLSALAFDVGFSSHSHFTSAFRHEFGVTPTAVRQLVGRHGGDQQSALRSAGRALTARLGRSCDA